MGSTGRLLRKSVGDLHPEETRNRPVFAAETSFMQNQFLRLSGKKDKVQRLDVRTENLEKQACEALKQTPPDGMTFAKNLILHRIQGGKSGAHFTNTDNELLGVKKLSEFEVEEVVKKYAY